MHIRDTELETHLQASLPLVWHDSLKEVRGREGMGEKEREGGKRRTTEDQEGEGKIS